MNSKARLSSALLSGLAVGAATMYVLDPGQGRRRRTVARDKMLRVARKGRRLAAIGARDLVHRARGVAAEAIHYLPHLRPNDEVLIERVRSAIGRGTSHPRAIEVHVHRGRVSLTGPVLRREVRSLLSHISQVDGVRQIDNHLKVHETSKGVTLLQGGRRRPSITGLAFLQANWPPALKLAAAGLSAASVLLALVTPTARIASRSIHSRLTRTLK